MAVLQLRGIRLIIPNQTTILEDEACHLIPETLRPLVDLVLMARRGLPHMIRDLREDGRHQIPGSIQNLTLGIGDLKKNLLLMVNLPDRHLKRDFQTPLEKEMTREAEAGRRPLGAPAKLKRKGNQNPHCMGIGLEKTASQEARETNLNFKEEALLPRRASEKIIKWNP